MAATPKRTPEKVSDFNTAELLAQQEAHEQNICDLQSRIEKLENCFGTPQKMADFFQDATEDSRKLDGVFAQMFCRFMKEHEDVQTELRQRLHEADRHYVLEKFKRWGGLFKSAVLIAVGAIGKEIITWLAAHLTTR